MASKQEALKSFWPIKINIVLAVDFVMIKAEIPNTSIFSELDMKNFIIQTYKYLIMSDVINLKQILPVLIKGYIIFFQTIHIQNYYDYLILYIFVLTS